MVSIAMEDLPVCRSPRISSRWPRPIGTRASTTMIPVCRGTLTGARFMIGGAGRSMGKRRLEAIGPSPIEWVAQWIDDPTDQSVTDRDIGHSTRPLDLIARMEVLALAQQYDADFVRIDVERDAEHAAGKLYQLIKAHTRNARHLGDADGDARYRAHLARCHLWRERFQRPANPHERPVESGMQTIGQAIQLSAFGAGAPVRGSGTV